MFRILMYISCPNSRIMKSAIFPRSPGFFCWKRIVDTKIWVLALLITSGMWLLLGALQLTEQGNIFVYILIHIYSIYSCIKEVHLAVSNLITTWISLVSSPCYPCHILNDYI